MLLFSIYLFIFSRNLSYANHITFIKVISFAVNYWSNGAMKAMFLRHEGYLGAVGAFIKDHQFPLAFQSKGVEAPELSPCYSSSDQMFLPKNQQRHSSKCWSESFATLLIANNAGPSPASPESITQSEFELEHLAGMSLEPFPLLLSPADYIPDTWDLTQDSKARVYWLECSKVSTVY